MFSVKQVILSMESSCYVISCAARTQNMHNKINFGSYVLTKKEWQQKCVKYNGQTLIHYNRYKLCYD